MRDRAQFLWLVALLGALGAGAAAALLLDRVDPKIRYAQQATLELGLPIAGTVPRLGSRGHASSPELLVQFVESFRTIRMQVLQSSAGRKPVLAIVGAAPEDGKSLVASNLALAFAEAGLRTVLVDADTRRGTLHRTFALPAAGGLTEYLAGEIDAATAARATGHEHLSLVSSGRRMERSPELLVSPRLRQLADELRNAFDVVLFDTPALAAGFDAFAVSAAAGHVLFVMRLGATERRLAAVKLSVLDRLPVEFIGAVLNGVDLTGEFQYYSYAATPTIDDAESAVAITDGAGTRADANVLREYPQLWSARHTRDANDRGETRALPE
jgi:capsular exopolysaccharide synthesis family protein